jgi:hypothetical protein
MPTCPTAFRPGAPALAAIANAPIIGAFSLLWKEPDLSWNLVFTPGPDTLAILGLALLDTT